jgi:hypothetical protein
MCLAFFPVGFDLDVWELNPVPGLGMGKAQSMPNVRGLLTGFLGNGALPAWAHWFLAEVMVLGVIFASRSWRGDERTPLTVAFCLWVVVMLVTSYYAKGYDLTLLLVPLLVLGKIFCSGGEFPLRPRTVFLAAAGVLLCTPLLWALVLKEDQFRWVAIVLLGLAAAIAAAEKAGRRGQEV